MAPNVSVHFWNANDINGATILEIDDEDEFFRGFKLTPDLYALGGWELTLARRVGFALFDSGAVQPEVFVRFLIHAWSDTDYYFGGLLQKRNQIVVHREEQGEETFIFGGPGPKAYMDRYRLGIEQLTGTGWNLDLENGVWRWNETATAGRVLNRIIAEDAAAADPSLPDLTKTFTDANDSDSNAWSNDVAGAGEYEIPIGQSLLTTIFDLEDLADLYTVVNLGSVGAPLYQLEAFEAYGTDVTGTSPGVGVGLLREGLNIANDSLTVEGVGIRKCTHVIVEGKDGAWATAVRPTWSSGDYIKWGKIEYTRSSNVNILERAGLRWLRRQDNGEKQLTVEIAPGASEATGFYFPGPGEVLWPGNTITLDTAEDGTTHTPLDFNNEDELLTGLDLTLGPAGDTATADKKAKSWDIKVRLNWERAGFAGAPDQTSAASGHPGAHTHRETERVEWLSTMHRYPLWAHRGDIGSVDSYPEQTLEAHRQAILKGADGTELDVWYSSDGTGWLSHDATVDRVTNGTGTIASKTDAALAALDVDGGYGYNAARHGTSLSLATLDDVLTALTPYDCIIKCQLNDSGVANARKLANMLYEAGFAERTVIEVSTTAEATAIKQVSDAFTTMVNVDVAGATGHADVDWLSVQEENITSLAYCTAKAPQRIGAYAGIEDYGIDESSDYQRCFDYGAASWQTENLDAALAFRKALLFGGSTTPSSGNGFWHPASVVIPSTAPEVAFTVDGDVALVWESGS